MNLTDLSDDFLDRVQEDGLSPFLIFQKWWQMAQDQLSGVSFPDAFSLSTICPDQQTPAVRVLLLKKIQVDGYVFFTNSQSLKGRSIALNPRAEMLFFWDAVKRQVRISGLVQMISRQETEEYFHSRPRESQIGAWASHQSEVVQSHQKLLQDFDQLQKGWEGKEIECPPFWNGYKLQPLSFEFWQGQSFRLHRRISFKRSSLDQTNFVGNWLCP